MVPARAEPVIGRAFARPVGLAGTTKGHATPLPMLHKNAAGPPRGPALVFHLTG